MNMNINSHIHKLLDHATRKPEKFTRIHSDDDGRYWMLRSQTRLPVNRITMQIFRNSSKFYAFDSLDPKENKIAIIFKRDKELAIIDTKKNQYYFGGNAEDDKEDDEEKFTAVIRIVLDGEIRLIVADSNSEALDVYSSDNEADGEATETLLGIMSGEIKEIEGLKEEVKKLEHFSFR